MPGFAIPAGYSGFLGNRLGLRSYTDLNSIYNARLDVRPPCAAPRKKPADRELRVEETWLAPGRLKPETLPPAGGLNPRIRGKRLVLDNMNHMSNVDTLVFGRDVDGSMSDGSRSMAHIPMYAGSAGLNGKFDRTPAWGELPPVCKRTFGETDQDPNSASGGWETVGYERLDPRTFSQKT